MGGTRKESGLPGTGARVQWGGLGPAPLHYLVKSVQKSLLLGQRREGGGHHLESPRRRWGGCCGLGDQMQGRRGRGGLVGPLAGRELELEVWRRGGRQPGGCLGGGHDGGGGGRREVGGWGQRPLRGLGRGSQGGLGGAWGSGDRGAGRCGDAQLVLDDEDARQGGGGLGRGAGVQSGL